MAKKALSAEQVREKLLEGLRQALDLSVHPLQSAAGAPGLFPSGAGGATFARQALAEGLVEEHTPLEPPKKGKTSKAVLVRLTEHGYHFVLENDNPAKMVGHLGAALQDQGAALSNSVAETRRELNGVQQSIDRLRQMLQEQIDRFERTSQTLGEMLSRSKPVPPPMQQGGTPMDGWTEQVPELVREFKLSKPLSRPTLAWIYQRIRERGQTLTLGQFHDGLRQLQAQRRIILGPYTQALATLEDPQGALYLDREVKYYVDLP